MSETFKILPLGVFSPTPLGPTAVPARPPVVQDLVPPDIIEGVTPPNVLPAALMNLDAPVGSAPDVPRESPMAENPVIGKLTTTDISRLGWELTLVPQAEADALVTYGLTPEELLRVKTSPIFLAAAGLAQKAAMEDPLASVRLLAQSALPAVIKQLLTDATSPRNEPRERTIAAKLLVDLADTYGGSGKTAAKRAPGQDGPLVQLNFGASVGRAVAAEMAASMPKLNES